MSLKTNNTSAAANKEVALGLRKWIIEERKIEYSKRDICSVYLKAVHSELSYRHFNEDFDRLDRRVRCDVNFLIHKKYLSQKRKLRNLKLFHTSVESPNNFSSHVFYPRFVNMTNVQFQESETKLIEKSYEFNIQPINNNKDCEILGVDCELVLNNLQKSSDFSVSSIKSDKYFSAKIIKKEGEKYNHKKSGNIQDIIAISSIKQKITDKEIVFTRADKGNTVIAISKEEYVSKTTDFLHSYEIVDSDPTEDYKSDIVDVIKSCCFFQEKDQFILNVMNPQPPKLYSLIKIHKEGNPIRPVVSFFTAPSYKLAKKLIPLLSANTNF